MVEGKMRKINMMTLGPRLSTYLPTCLLYIFYVCPWKLRGQEDFSVVLLLSSILWSLFMQPRVPCMFLRAKLLEISVTHAT